MTFEIGALIAMIAGIIGGAVGYGRLQRQVEDLKEEDVKLWTQLSKLREWKEEHDKDVSDKRVEYEREISKLRESINSKDGKLDTIISRLDTIDKKIDKLEDREERDRSDRR